MDFSYQQSSNKSCFRPKLLTPVEITRVKTQNWIFWPLQNVVATCQTCDAGLIPYPVEKLHLPWPDISVRSHPSATTERCWQRWMMMHLHCRLTRFLLSAAVRKQMKLWKSRAKTNNKYHMISCASWALKTMFNQQSFPTFKTSVK